MSMKLIYTLASVGGPSGELLNLHERLFMFGKKKSMLVRLWSLCSICVATSVKPFVCAL